MTVVPAYGKLVIQTLIIGKPHPRKVTLLQQECARNDAEKIYETFRNENKHIRQTISYWQAYPEEIGTY